MKKNTVVLRAKSYSEYAWRVQQYQAFTASQKFIAKANASIGKK